MPEPRVSREGHYVIITTETLREIEDESRHDIILKEGKMEQGGGKKTKMVDTGEQTSHDMTEIAIIKENTIPMLRMEQALKGVISWRTERPAAGSERRNEPLEDGEWTERAEDN